MVPEGPVASRTWPPHPRACRASSSIEPAVHRDARGFFVETFRADDRRALGIREEWVQDNHSRSARGVLRGMHFSVGARPGEARALRARGDPRRGRGHPPRLAHLRALGRGGARRRGPPPDLPARSASPTASWCVSDVADVVYQLLDLLRPGARAGLRLGRPGRRHRLARPRRRGLGARRLGARGCARSPTSCPSSTRAEPRAGEHQLAEPQVGVGAGVPRVALAPPGPPRGAPARRGGRARRRSAPPAPRPAPRRRRASGKLAGRVAHHLEVRRVVAHDHRRARGHALHDHRVRAADLGRART